MFKLRECEKVIVDKFAYLHASRYRKYIRDGVRDGILGIAIKLDATHNDHHRVCGILK